MSNTELYILKQYLISSALNVPFWYSRINGIAYQGIFVKNLPPKIFMTSTKYSTLLHLLILNAYKETFLMLSLYYYFFFSARIFYYCCYYFTYLVLAGASLALPSNVDMLPLNPSWKVKPTPNGNNLSPFVLFLPLKVKPLNLNTNILANRELKWMCKG